MSNPEMVTISLAEYLRLERDSEFLNALRNAGVDNWDGYGYAQESMEDDEDE